MQLSNNLLVCATLIAATVAQTSTTTSLHFTSIPTSLVAGVKQTIGWAGGNGNGVNVILQQGPADNLQDVPIAPIASGDEGTSTTWTPPKSLPDAGNYALRIEQGEDTVNYSGMLQLFGGCSTCPTDAVAALASTSTSISSTRSATASSPSSTASSGPKSGVVTPDVSSGTKSSSNSTGAAGSSANSTTTGSSVNSTMSTGSTANTTLSGTNSTTNSTTKSTTSSAKLHATSSKSSSSSSSTSSSTSSSSSETTSSSTGSSTSPSTTKKSSGVTVAASNFALVLCAIVGIVYLG
ncbi:MAG: hypothetical protein ALECFALPRED_005522 [Alectoria fallacina]|uniref:Yeast cell wall synthesis Kre9/Knh1-like N-terminal domain-containing protein n=1 Tax=Alectoria fallacina TaxID=1903189 RepID=A0A8H3I8U6_9LECA|nr:MAG: hypothetical protein ALECFALPRED_005522 [Alectoria fallacina]